MIRMGCRIAMVLSIVSATANAQSTEQQETSHERDEVRRSFEPSVANEPLAVERSTDINEAEMENLIPGRVTILREGRYLRDVDGQMQRNQRTRWWRFTIQSDDPMLPPIEMTVLPCALLEEIERMAEALDTESFLISATGRVLLYQGRNYFLPTHAPRLGALQPDAKPKQAEPRTQPDQTEPETTAHNEKSSITSIEDIERRLKIGAGPVKRSTSLRAEPEGGISAIGAELMPQGTIVVMRRGHLGRTSAGARVFIFEADAEGLKDPPLVLLPSLMLENIEEYALEAGTHAAILMSGEVFTYDRRNYILPTGYRVSRSRTALVP